MDRKFINRIDLVALNDGNAFGTTGQGYMRMNVACSRSLLEEAMGRLHHAIKVWRTTQPVTATVE